MPQNVPTKVTVAEIESSADAVAWIAEDFRKIAADMRSRGISEITAVNTGNFEFGSKRLHSAIDGLRRGLRKAIGSKGIRSDDHADELDADEGHPVVKAAKERGGKKVQPAKKKPDPPKSAEK